MGAGTGYHIDSKYSSSLPWEDIVGRFDSKANLYAQQGRNIVFSNQGMDYAAYNPKAEMAAKVALLQKAAGAHAPREGFRSFDYFAPKGTDVWDKSAEGAPIYLAVQDGRTPTISQAPDYGVYGAVTDQKGNVLGKSGHGDTKYAGQTYEPPYATFDEEQWKNADPNRTGPLTINNYYSGEQKEKKQAPNLTNQLLVSLMQRQQTKDPFTAMMESMIAGSGKLPTSALYNFLG
jgi:hypothetical protein